MNIVIFLRDRAHPISFRLPAWLAAVASSLLLAGIVGNLFWLNGGATGGAALAQQQATDQQTLAMRAELEEQKSVLQALRAQSVSDTQAVGRRLALMQAQFMRLEAVGQRLTEVAGLVDGEFSFGQPAAVGGPTMSVPTLEVTDLDGAHEQTGSPEVDAKQVTALTADFATQLDRLAERLASREMELNVLGGLMATRKLEDERSPRPRPITWGWLSSPYGNRVDPISGRPGWHGGVDYAGEEGSSVVAVAGGVVTYAGTRSGYGELVEINHGDGYVTRYGHHKELLVEVGDVVKKGEQVGLMGSTGRSTGPHVHFEVLRDGKEENPARFLGRSS